MRIEFDPDKDVANVEKHGISLAEAARMDFAAAIRRVDERHAYGERRFQALGPIAGRIHVLVYTMRGETLRVISLRKANSRERKLHAERS